MEYDIRRRWPRKSFVEVITITLLTPGGIAESCHTAQTLNISRGGICLLLDGPLANGASVEIAFERFGQRVAGTILRVQNADDVWSIGVEFLEALALRP